MAEEQSPGEPQLKNPKSYLPWIYTIIIIGILGFWLFSSRETVAEITWSEFKSEMLLNGDIEKINVVNNERVEVTVKKERLAEVRHKEVPKKSFSDEPMSGPHYYFNIGSVEVFHADLEEAMAQLPQSEQIDIIYSKRENWVGNILAWVLPFVIILFIWRMILRRATSDMGGMGQNMFNFGRSKARVMEQGAKSKVTFNDVAGLEEAKEEIYEMVKFLKTPEKYKSLGAKIPKGVLLVGPPGSGKTLLAKAVAGEAGVPFFSLSGSEFIEMFVGVGAARMRDLFAQAKSKAPSIIFIDEIDTVGRARDRVKAFQTNDERESTLNQLLAEMDGFDTDVGVIVLAATNRGDVLDPALLRPGRFDRHVHLELPSLKERFAIFEVHMRPLKLSENIDKDILAAQTAGFSGADIANVCNEAALIAAREDNESVRMNDFFSAIDRVVGGLEKKSKIITFEEKRRIAYHECGHVITSWFLKNAYPVLKVTIIPRGRSLGASWFLPEERQIITKSQFTDNICTLLGGRVAEELTFDDISSNALDDLEKATKQAYTMVLNYGLGDELRNLSYYDSTGTLEQSFQKPFSEKTAEIADGEIKKIIDEAYEKAKKILHDHKKELDSLAKLLIEKEVLQRNEIEEILGVRELNIEKKEVEAVTSN